MKQFNHPNTSNNWTCMVCGTNEDKPVTLIGIAGTENGHNIRAEQVHVECIDLMYDDKSHVLFQYL